MRFLAGRDLADRIALEDDLVIRADNAEVLPRLPGGAFDLIYIDPPFNTGRAQARTQISVIPDPDGDRVGFAGRRYATTELPGRAYADAFGDYQGFIAPRLDEARRLLASHGTLYFHIDYREAHYCKILLDQIFGRQCFLNEIIWAYDYGARTKRRWPAKHDTILVYVKDPTAYHFDSEEVDREPYMAPGLQTPERAAAGKLPVDVWWHTIVPTSGREKTGYPTQKPEGIVRRMVAASSRPDGWCLDFFAGSGTLGAAALGLGRRFVLVDSNPEAIDTCRTRLEALADSPSRPALPASGSPQSPPGSAHPRSGPRQPPSGSAHPRGGSPHPPRGSAHPRGGRSGDGPLQSEG
ncbi:MAG TPA: site-specific DNA-methyltransferase [Solirubrobacteraceae bacterium]|jgi:site-specific DNA-methyltransferase (adenine-specific)